MSRRRRLSQQQRIYLEVHDRPRTRYAVVLRPQGTRSDCSAPAQQHLAQPLLNVCSIFVGFCEPKSHETSAHRPFSAIHMLIWRLLFLTPLVWSVGRKLETSSVAVSCWRGHRFNHNSPMLVQRSAVLILLGGWFGNGSQARSPDGGDQAAPRQIAVNEAIVLGKGARHAMSVNNSMSTTGHARKWRCLRQSHLRLCEADRW